MNTLQELGKNIAGRVENGMIIGVGTGSTVAAVIECLGERMAQEKLRFSAYTTSHESTARCRELGIVVHDPLTLPESLDLGFDGADEVDPRKRLIKGKGGAFLREKIVASVCKQFIVCITEQKLVKKLGEKTPVPVEVIPASVTYVTAALKSLGATNVVLRRLTAGLYGPVITEQGNMILDATFSEIVDTLEFEIKTIVGVVESGLFLTQATEIAVANQ